MFKAFMIGAMKHYHDNNDFSMGHPAPTVIIPFPVFACICKSSSTEHGVKNLAEFIGHYKYFSNFVFGEHSDNGIGL